MTTTCPCCGSTLDRVDPVQIAPYIGLTPAEQIVYDKLAKSFGTKIKTDALISALYADRPDGGPTHADVIVKMHTMRIRNKLKEKNIPITIKGWSARTMGAGMTSMLWV